MTAHIIFDFNMDTGFARKARFIAEGEKIDTSPLVTYTSVVSINNVWTVLMLAALDVLDVNILLQEEAVEGVVDFVDAHEGVLLDGEVVVAGGVVQRHAEVEVAADADKW